MADDLDQFAGRRQTLGLLMRNRAFRLFSIGNFASLAAIWVIRVCVAWLTWEMTQSKTWLGLMVFAELGPSLAVSVYGGNLVDRGDRFEILKRGQVIQIVLALLLVVLILTRLNSVWWMLVIMFGFSVAGGLTLPARLSVAPALVETQQLSTASAVGSITLNVTRLIGPLVAAPAIAGSYEWLAFALAAVLFGLNRYLLGTIRPEETKSATQSAPARHGGYGEVIRIVLQQRALVISLLLQFALWLLVRPLTDMLPAFADQVFKAGESGFALLTAMVGAGAIFGAFWVMASSDALKVRRAILTSSVIASGAMATLALVNNIWLGLLVLAVYGASVTMAGVAATTYVQLRTPIERLGRVMGIYSIIFRFAPAVGAVTLGAAADYFGLASATLAFPLAALFVVALCWRPFMASDVT